KWLRDDLAPPHLLNSAGTAVVVGYLAHSQDGAPGPADRAGADAEREDPEELPGYKLGKKDDRPDFNSFLPPGAGVGTAGAQVPSRGISGMVGSNLQEGMHPSSTDIFKAVSNRYRQLEFTLFADK
ncbi:MAG TPA: hypothetical protein PL182_10315, partial [Pseudobdellovibrionaceae bacterium]|nr:hypothetical protein [Pseudobdellovibrionaceae bacterium]